MKKLALFIVILLIVFSLIPVANSGTGETEIYSMLQQKGFEKIYVSTDNDMILIKLGFDAIPKNISVLLLNTALESFEKYNKANGVFVEAYLNDVPQFGLFINGKDATDYFEGKLSNEEIEELAIPVDLRNDFQELSDDLLEYGIFAESIFFEKDTLNIISEYFGKKEDLNPNFLGALFSAVQDCPYAKNISLKIRDNKELNVATVQSKDVLSLMNGEITSTEFQKRITFSKEKMGKGSPFAGIFKNGKNTNGILAIALLLISIVLFAISGKKKSKIAKILKAKRINLNKIPQTKKRIYGKFNGIIHSENPLIAPFSRKEVIIYKGKVEEKGKKNDFNTVWKKEFSTDFFITNSNGDKKLLVYKDSMPHTDLSVLTKRRLSEDEIKSVEKEIGEIRSKNLFVSEKGLENGRKVFFIGGMERDENGNLVFIKRKNYPNFISIHSEKRLTGHTIRISNTYKVIGFISLFAAIYFAFLYIK